MGRCGDQIAPHETKSAEARENLGANGFAKKRSLLLLFLGRLLDGFLDGFLDLLLGSHAQPPSLLIAQTGALSLTWRPDRRLCLTARRLSSAPEIVRLVAEMVVAFGQSPAGDQSAATVCLGETKNMCPADIGTRSAES
jgi:hypothetical protein